tara:strand:- start:481 stop:873 length:393 start_codon:yes stop_codon:yes gene_type:complete
MEILVYISGVFTAALIVSIVSFLRTNKKYTSLLESNQHITNISSIRNAEVNERLDEMMDIVRVIQSDYVPNGELNQKIEGMESDLSGIYKIAERNRAFAEQSKQQLLNDISQLKQNIKQLGEDPNFLSRY